MKRKKKVYCKNCKWRKKGNDRAYYCELTVEEMVVFGNVKGTFWKFCAHVNENNDCPDFEEQIKDEEVD
jgi:hypothetical protein